MNIRMALFSAVLAFSLVASSAIAAASEFSDSTETDQTVTTQAEASAEAEVTEEGEQTEETEAEESGKAKGKGLKGADGLQNAYENVIDTPAGERIAAKLLEKYGIDVTITADTDLSVLAEALESEGEVEAAADVQAEAVLTDPENVELYKKLGKLKTKLGQKGTKTYVNGKEKKFDVPPVIKEGRTLVPFRGISEALNADVSWDSETKTVTVTRDDVEVKLTLGSKTAYINGKEVALDVPGQLKSNRVIVPMRFLSEALSAKVLWEQETQSVIVLDPGVSEEAQTE